MSKKKTWAQFVGALALAIGVSSAMLGGTLAAFAAAEETPQGVRVAPPYLAGLSDARPQRTA